MKVLTTFNFTNYPELKEKYKKLMALRNKFSKITNNNLQGYDDNAILEDITRYELGEMSECTYNTFANKVKFIYHEVKGLKKWEDVFGKTFNNLTNEQRQYLVGLIDGNYIYLLPSEYYDEDLKFQNL